MALEEISSNKIGADVLVVALEDRAGALDDQK